MRLKQIKLMGFKSFVDPTVLHLNAQLVGIVGPNGCGKSNIIDAIRWVLGESSAKDLRGESMIDVIFNGSTTRKPVGQAAIELLFDNLDGKLDREYANFSEVSIRREIDRNRQSEYYLNDRKCRKRDITDLFAGTGLLQNGYAIIGQGTVSKIIESKPAELRGFVEEAADISIYKKRRHETELRMQHTEENLNRLQDIILEQTRSLEKLDKQQAAAYKYQQYQAEKQDCEVKLLSIKAFKLNQQVAEFELEIKHISVELEKYLLKKTNLGLSLEQHKIDQTEKFDNVALAQEDYYALNTRVAKLEQTLQYKKEQKIKCQNDLSILNIEITKIAAQHAEDQTLQDNLAKELLAINTQYTELENIKHNAEKEHEAAQRNMQTWNSNFNALHIQFLDSHNKTEKIKYSIEQIENLSKELGSRIEKLNQESASYDQASLSSEVLLVETELRTKEALQKEHLQTLLQITELVKHKKAIIKALLEQKNNLQASRHQLLGTIGATRTLQNNALEINSAKSSAWLEKAKLGACALFLEQLVIEEGWEIAVGVILGKYLDARLLPNDISLNEIFRDLLQDIKNFKLVLIESLNQNNNQTNNQDLINLNNNILLINKIKNQNNFIITNLFNNIYIAEDLAYAIEHRNNLLPDQYFVTKKGELVGCNWLLIDTTDPKQQVLLRNKELQQLDLKLQNVDAELLNINSGVAVAEQELITIEQQQLSIEASYKAEENNIRNLIASCSSKKSKLDSIKLRLEKIIIEIKEYQVKIRELSEKESSLRTELETAIDASSNCTEQKQLLSDQKPEIQKILDHASEANKIAVNNFHQIALKQQSITNQSRATETAKQRLLGQLQNLQQKQLNLQQELQANNAPLQPLELELAALLDDRLAQETKLNVLKAQLDDVEENITQIEQSSNNLTITLEQYRARIEQLKLEQNRDATKLAVVMEDVTERNITLDLNLSENAELNSESNIDLLQTKLDQALKNIEKLGAVNLAAIEEFALETERKAYLDLQQVDLTTALATLREAILKIDHETRKKFKITFDQINDNFQKLFPKLFGGGGAKLELESEDLLASGVNVLAQPPGKKNSSIYLLSGGEKALTAVALIFAIFQLNPAPFCILDEVDAPLDDANVTRFSNLIVDLSTQVQFIFITHNKTTMKIANQLTGVTMKEPGVSRLVSVNVDEAVEMVN